MRVSPPSEPCGKPGYKPVFPRGDPPGKHVHKRFSLEVGGVVGAIVGRYLLTVGGIIGTLLRQSLLPMRRVVGAVGTSLFPHGGSHSKRDCRPLSPPGGHRNRREHKLLSLHALRSTPSL